MKKIFLFIMSFMIMFSPFLVSEAVDFNGLVPVCNTTIDKVNGGFKDPCDFDMVMALINKVINFLLFVIATPLVALIICYAGWLYLSSSENPSNISKAISIFKNVLIGYVIGLASWLIVKTILVTLGAQITFLS